MEPDKKESYLFFYDGQPIKMTYNYNNSKVRFKKLRNRKKYSVFKGETIVSCKNKFYLDKGAIMGTGLQSEGQSEGLTLLRE